jgi:hypothetical protein
MYKYDFEIEKGIVMSAPKKGVRAQYPFAQMKTGDSITIKKSEGPARVTSAAYKYGQENGKKFAFRSLSGGRRRLWRTK